MKNKLTVLLLTIPFFLTAQEDTTIYKIVGEMPRFPGCEKLDTTLAAKAKCAEVALLSFFNRNIVYPFAARQANTQGTVVISMVVEPDGLISNPKILRDIGDGCGAEAIRVAEGMNQAMREEYLRWTPGKKDGKIVRTEITLPIKFRLEEPKDYVLVDGRDTLYVVTDDSLSYKGGILALEPFLKNTMKTPENFADSCKAGIIDMTLYIHPTGYVRVIDLSDYWHLGTDFQWEAIKAATATWGEWIPATRKGRQVPSSVQITLPVLPKEGTCPQVISDFEKANLLADEGSILFNEGKEEEGIAKLTEAIALFPENANFLYLRGQAYMNMDKNEEACVDFKRIRAIATIGLVENILPLLCN